MNDMHYHIYTLSDTHFQYLVDTVWHILSLVDTEWHTSVEQELLTLPEHLSSPPDFSGVRVTRSLVVYVCFVDRCLSFCPFSFGHCVVCFSSIYGFWLPLWYLQALLVIIQCRIHELTWYIIIEKDRYNWKNKFEEKFKDTKRVFRIRRWTDNTMTKRKMTKEQTMIYKHYREN